MSDVTVVVLAHGDEPWLRDCIDSVLASRGVDPDVVVVDNGCTDRDLVDSLRRPGRVRVVRPGVNLGYAGGANTGADAARADVIAFVNSDALVRPDALAALAAALDQPGVGLATSSVRLAEQPETLNSAGNPVHLAGIGWAGHFGEPATRYAQPRRVTSVSGAGFAVRRDTWADLGGFAAEWFAYNEDADLSLRAWQRGWEVVYVPDAVVLHHYEFSRNARKSYLLERNRLLNVLTLYQGRTLLVLSPVLVVFEVGMLALAARQGWLGEKLAGYRWLAGHAAFVLARRRSVQRARRRPDRELADLLTSRLDPANVAVPAGVGVVNAAFAAYWSVARRLL